MVKYWVTRASPCLNSWRMLSISNNSAVLSLEEQVSLAASQITFAVGYKNKFSPLSGVMEVFKQDITMLFSAFQRSNPESSFVGQQLAPDKKSTLPLPTYKHHGLGPLKIILAIQFMICDWMYYRKVLV